ncbi:MAG: thiolase domain-containing protein [Deltaproteobacteria bacterium]|nr:MAG: thiolase domain-containing protein [Deltaproteobacteria bacterium]
MPLPRIYILGGHQTDFAKNWTREGLEIDALLKASVEGALEQTQLEPSDLDVAHVGNFVAELFCGQGQLGGLFASIHPDFVGLPTSRHEAACASGSMAVLAATAELEAGRYQVACVSGVELMRNVDGQTAAEHLGAAMWAGHEAHDARFPWPYQFSQIADHYAERYGLKYEHLAAIAQTNFSNAKKNPNAQTRRWKFTEASFQQDDEANPVIEGRLRKQDCGQITDGSASIILATEDFAASYAQRRSLSLDALPYIQGWGHRTAPIPLEAKFALGQGQEYLFPHLRETIVDAYRRANIAGPEDMDGVETHDCFTISEYVALEHIGLTPPGEAWKAVEEETIALVGSCPVNASGGLIGCGHPVGATGVRMLLDAYKQTTGQAGDYQIENAERVMTLNIGGSLTTVAAFVVGTN